MTSDLLLDQLAAEFQGARVGLVAHQASIDARGRHTADVLEPTRLFGPEHGFFGWGAAGEKVLDAEHPWLGVPVASLYGENRKPSAEQLKDLDVIVVDLQDLGFRCYTFVSTLFLVMQAAAECDVPVVVFDRPVPLPGVFDGPRLKSGFENFVAQVDVPMSYGLTPGETARWIVSQGLAVGLDVMMLDPGAFEVRIPPSPAIRSTMTCWTYLATVFAEACAGFDVDRHGPIPFQTISSAWFEPGAIPDLPGAELHNHTNPSLHPGLRIHVTDTALWRPVEASVRILAALPPERVWENAKEDFFDKLYGTDEVRLALKDGDSADAIIERWQPGLVAFEEETFGLRSLYAMPFSGRSQNLFGKAGLLTVDDLLAETPASLSRLRTPGVNKVLGEVEARFAEFGIEWPTQQGRKKEVKAKAVVAEERAAADEQVEGEHLGEQPSEEGSSWAEEALLSAQETADIDRELTGIDPEALAEMRELLGESFGQENGGENGEEEE